MIYRHRQTGTVLLAATGGAAVMAAVAATMTIRRQPSAVFAATAASAIVLGVAALFHSLTVEVDEEAVRIQFGSGLIRKRFPVSEIEDARAVRNRWWYGWGIRFTPHGWLYNVSGFDAVEIGFRSGKRVRIGTDDPAGLEAAIRRAAGLA